MTGSALPGPAELLAGALAACIETDEPEHRLDLLHRNVRKFGTITDTVAATCDLDGEIIAVRM